MGAGKSWLLRLARLLSIIGVIGEYLLAVLNTVFFALAGAGQLGEPLQIPPEARIVFYGLWAATFIGTGAIVLSGRIGRKIEGGILLVAAGTSILALLPSFLPLPVDSDLPVVSVVLLLFNLPGLLLLLAGIIMISHRETTNTT